MFTKIRHLTLKKETPLLRSNKKKSQIWICTLSLPLFNCYIEKVINKVKIKLAKVNIGIIIGGETISTIRFAGDIVMIADCEANLQRTINEMDETFRASEMKMISAKTTIWICARNPKIKAEIYIDNQKLEQVNEMGY